MPTFEGGKDGLNVLKENNEKACVASLGR